MITAYLHFQLVSTFRFTNVTVLRGLLGKSPDNIGGPGQLVRGALWGHDTGIAVVVVH